MNKYRFASGHSGMRAAIQFNKYPSINFPFWSLRLPPSRITSPHHPCSSSSRNVEEDACDKEEIHRTISNSRYPRLFVHAFVLRLLTASRALRKFATFYARLHFINFGFLRFSLHTARRRVVRRFRKPCELRFSFQ